MVGDSIEMEHIFCTNILPCYVSTSHIAIEGLVRVGVGASGRLARPQPLRGD